MSTRVGVIVGSIREERRAAVVAQWVVDAASASELDLTVDLIDLRAFDVPLFTGAQPMMTGRDYPSPQVTAWSEAVDACDAYVFVTPEYNHGVPGAFKNAVDSLGHEWVGKAVGFVSYGADGGVRCVEHWRTIVANFSMVGVRQQVALSLFHDFGTGGLTDFTPIERRQDEVRILLEQLVSMSTRLRGSAAS